MDPFLGEIRLFGFNWAPNNWQLCQGQLMNISEYTALFSVLGTNYGGDGIKTFALPDMRGLAMKAANGEVSSWCIAIQGVYPSRP